MASSSGPALNEELQCSICLEVFTDPVTTPCGHNFCRSCLSKCWTDTQTCFSPHCTERLSKRPDLKINTTLRDFVQLFKKLNLGEPEVFCDVCDERKQKAVKTCLTCQNSYCETHLKPHLRVPRLKKHKLITAVENLEDYICQKHERPLELFCRDDQMCVCVYCYDGEHKTHNIVLIKQESEEKKNQLFHTQTDVEKMIQSRMKKIEENRYVKERKCWALIKMYSSLYSRPRTKNWIEIRNDSDLNVKYLVRALIVLKETQDDTLQDQLISTGLKFVQKFAVDVTLDPDTANPSLSMSYDGKCVFHIDIKRNVPENPKRSDKCLCVLAKQGFSSRRFYYEVEVKGNTDWTLGVARESIKRKGVITIHPSYGVWAVYLRNENEYLASDNSLVSLSLREKPEKVGVFVDYEEGLVSFYDVESRSNIYSFTGQTFRGKLYPYFSPGCNDKGKNSYPMIITPVSPLMD